MVTTNCQIVLETFRGNSQCMKTSLASTTFLQSKVYPLIFCIKYLTAWPFLELACEPWPTSCWLDIHAMYADWTWDSICAKSVPHWRHLNANHVITWPSGSFAMSACKNPLMTVTSVGGKRSFTITLYLLIRWSKTLFLSTYGLQSIINIHALAVTATPLGVGADGYAGDKLRRWILWYFLFQQARWHCARVYRRWASFATRVGGNPESKLKLSDTFHVQSCRSWV